MTWSVLTTLALTLQLSHSVWTFDGDACVLAHNVLRKKHVGTNDVVKSKQLEDAAKQYARRLRGSDTSVPVQPTRSVPRRKRRSIEDGINPEIHLELWDGDITYPSAKDNWLVNLNRNSKLKIGRSIHKFCCSRFTKPIHCPKEFFHGLSFPPSANGVVSDMYKEEEKYYDYNTGRSKTIYSTVNHFARIVWKNTTEVGCGQSLVSNDGCVFTVLLYRLEGGVGSTDEFIKNVGRPIATETDSPATKIVLVIFVIALVIGVIILMYCCRHNIDEKYRSTMMEIDVLKAEQELETDSTSFWWMRPLVPKKSDQVETKPSRAAYHSVKERPTIDVIPTTSPRRGPSLKNIPRPSLSPESQQQPNVNQLVNRYRGMSLKRQDYQQMKLGSNPPIPPSRPPMFKPNTSINKTEEVQVRGPSGKSTPPPPAPAHQTPRSKPPPPINKPNTTAGSSPKVIPSRPILPSKPSASKQPGVSDSPTPSPRPLPAPRRAAEPQTSTSTTSGSETPPKRPILPPNKPPPTQTSDGEGDRPMTIAERRKLLEGNK